MSGEEWKNKLYFGDNVLAVSAATPLHGVEKQAYESRT